MEPAALDAAAAALFAHRTGHGGVPIDDLPEAIRPGSLDDGYKVQDRLGVLLAGDSRFGPPNGWKIGCTTQVMQDMLGIPHPCAGQLYSASTFEDRATVRLADYCFLRLECEIAVRLGRDLPAGQDHTTATVRDAVAEIMASVELVDNRFGDPARAGIATLAGDDFFSAGCVFGAPVAVTEIDDPAALSGGFSVGGAAPERTGSGADILGHPYAALAWLANHRAGRGAPLRAGTRVTLGAIVPPYRPSPGDVVETRIEGLPSVRIAVE